jgi:hypothetical protein
LSNNFEMVQKATFTQLDFWLQNFARNLPKIWKGESVKKLSVFDNNTNPIKNNIPSEAAIVIGGGPSVTEKNHLEKISTSKFVGTIVCTDRMLIPALKSGITPDRFPNFYVLTIDGVKEQARFYDADIVKEYNKKIHVVLSSFCAPEVVEICESKNLEIYWCHPLIDDFRRDASINKIINIMSKSDKHPKGLPSFQTGGNVGTSCWVFSWAILGKSPIVLIGINFGYPGDTPIENTLHYDELLEASNNNKEIVKKYYKILHNPDYNCDVVVDPVFDCYREGFCDLILRTPEWVKTINATEGGSLFGEKIKSMKLSDFLD